MERFLPQKNEKEVISMRIPTHILVELDSKATAFGISRNELMNQCIVFALEHMEEPKAD